MISIAQMSLTELVAHIQTHLEAQGIRTVLSGGSCVTIWSNKAYRSDDIDMIPEGIGQRKQISSVMKALGFSEERRYFTHPETKLFVVFPAGPMSVGEERPREITNLITVTGSVRLLSPTDCVKDRLTWWFHCGDRQCLEQAVAVAAVTDVDGAELRRWASGERKAAEYEAIAGRLTRS